MKRVMRALNENLEEIHRLDTIQQARVQEWGYQYVKSELKTSAYEEDDEMKAIVLELNIVGGWN